LKGTVLGYPPAVSSVIFGIFGLLVCATMVAVCWRLARQTRNRDGTSAGCWFLSVDGFLVLWLLLEVLGYFALSPHSAIRRIMGITFVASLLSCRLAARTCRARQGLLWGACAFNLLMALFLFGVDAMNYQGQKDLAENLVQEFHRQHPDATIWSYGYGSFAFYGERAGMKSLANSETRVSAHDWVMVLEFFEDRFASKPAGSRCVFTGRREWTPSIPLRSRIQSGGAAVTHLEEPVLRVGLFQVQ
jgi:hypothetical protein